ncbi:MAG: ABC transporter permease [Ardenticatenales bacterium]|nr:ABC transporter permease [Ardenticatenales bacterium]
MLERIGVIFRKEITDNIRDRRTLLASLVYPLFGPILLAVLLSFLGNTITAQSEKPLRLPVSGAEYAPALIAFLRQNDVEIVEPPADPENAVREGTEEVVLLIPEGYGDEMNSGRPATVRLVVDESRQSATGTIERARRLLTGYSQQLGSLRLLARGISPNVTSPLAIERVNVATPQSQAANVLSMAPYFIIFSIFIGGMYLAIDTTTGERERGSLEPLLITPVPRSELVLAKMAATLLFTVIAVIETLVAFGILLNVIPSRIAVSLDPSVLVAIFFITLPIMLLAAALQMIVATYSAGFKEAQNYLSFMMLIPALPGMFLAFAPVRPTLWTMLIPTFGQQILMGQVMRGTPVDPSHIITSAAVTLLVALALVVLAVRLYAREDVLFRR